MEVSKNRKAPSRIVQHGLGSDHSWNGIFKMPFHQLAALPDVDGGGGQYMENNSQKELPDISIPRSVSDS